LQLDLGLVGRESAKLTAEPGVDRKVGVRAHGRGCLALFSSASQGFHPLRKCLLQPPREAVIRFAPRVE
jgi:hypothetical protein